MKKTCFWVLIGLCMLSKKINAQVWSDYSSFYPGIGIQLGSSGLGLQGTYPLSPELAVRGGFNVVPTVKFKIRNSISELKRSDAELMLDWQPLYGKKTWMARKWIASIGAGYFFNNQFVRYVGSVKTDNQPLDYTVDWSKFRPYLGTGLNGIRVGYHFNLAVRAGYFFPTSHTDIEAYEKDPDGISHVRNRVDSFPYNVLPGLQVQVDLFYIFF